jgi:signal transduction histidine kinase
LSTLTEPDAVLVKINDLPVEPGDLIEEPDFHPSFAEWAAFYQRQAVLRAAMEQQEVRLSFKPKADGELVTVIVQPVASRPLSDLPLVFWFQLAVGAISLVVGAWVASIRPQLAAAWCLALTGIGLLLATFPAAVYSTRELAFPPQQFHALSVINHTGAMTFGVGLVGIFWVFPQALGSVRWIWGLAGLFALWAVADAAWWVPSADFGTRLAVLVQMLLAIGLGVWQWRRAKHRADDRAAIRWVLLTFLVGSGGFISLVIVSSFLRWVPPLSQGWSFGLFLSVYVGLALGVFRYRLFDLDRWSLQLLLWAFGLLTVVALDAALISLLRWDAQASLATSLLVCAGLYFPLRQWLWLKLVAKRQISLSNLLPDVLQVALAEPAARSERWRQLLGKAFAPESLQSHPADLMPDDEQAALRDNGLSLWVAPLQSGRAEPCWRLAGYDQGRALFGRTQLDLARQLVLLTQQLVASRVAYEQGAREERLRIAGDLHDDLGARLLSLAHAAQGHGASAKPAAARGTEQDASFLSDMAREALADLRLVVRGMTADAAPLVDLTADWRAEAASRLQASGIELRFDLMGVLHGVVLPPRLAAQATRVVREAVSNVIKHSQAKACEIQVQVDTSASPAQLCLQVSDNGRGLGDVAAQGSFTREGYGLRNLARRVEAVGGALEVTNRGDGPGCSVRFRMPL